MSTRTISITIGKETLEFPVNHSGWISTEKGANPLPKGWTTEKLIGLERLRYNSKHIPTVVIGTREVKLGTEFLTPKEKDEFNRLNRIARGTEDEKGNKIAGATSRGSTRSAVPTEVIEELKTFLSTLRGEKKAELAAIIDKLAPDPKIVALMKAGYSMEQAKKMLAALGN